MREILFRGKRRDNGEWVEGNFMTGMWYLDDRSITAISPVDDVFYPHDEISGYDEVIPETVGQYTGLCDKNGKKIFEGDIATYDDDLVVIEWHDEDAMFYTRGLDGTNWTTNFCEIGGYFIEVIGNIHDNSELLEVDNNE